MWTDDSILHLVWFSVFIFRGIEFFLLKCPHPPLLDHHALPRTSLACSIKSQFRKKLYLQKLGCCCMYFHISKNIAKFLNISPEVITSSINLDLIFDELHVIFFRNRLYFQLTTDWWKNSEIDTSRPVLGELSISDFDNFFSESI